MSASEIKWVRLGDYIEQCDKRNSDGTLTVTDVQGISTDKCFISTKANLDGVSVLSYKIVAQSEFAYVADTSRRGDKIALALNLFDKDILISSIYTVFRSIDKDALLPEYLFLMLNRPEFDRYSRFNSWGSARETFDWSEMERVQIPLPSIEVQRELVATYNGLKTLAEQNEALIPRLSAACQAYIVDCCVKYPSVKLGEYISVDDITNSENRDLEFLGININKEFMLTSATTEGLNKQKYKVLTKGRFVFSGMQTGRDVAIRIGLYSEDADALISPAYTTFSIAKDKHDKLLPEYLFLQFNRTESDRLGWFYSDGSIRSNLDWSRFCEFQIPLPSLDVQQAIVDVYRCMERAQYIASQAREKLKTLCPSLVQRAAHS